MGQRTLRSAAVVVFALLAGATARPAAADTSEALKGKAAAHQVGAASWYGPGFHGRRTASGERYNQNAMTAAHRRLPLGTNVKVTNLENGREVVVEINDRGPYIRNRVIDLSRGAASRLGMVSDGIVKVRIDVLPRGGGRATVADAAPEPKPVASLRTATAPTTTPAAVPTF